MCCHVHVYYLLYLGEAAPRNPDPNPNPTPNQVEELFLALDTDCGGSISLGEFLQVRVGE